MTKSVRVPDPVYKRISAIAEREDISRGAVIKEWMEKADKFEEMEGRMR